MGNFNGIRNQEEPEENLTNKPVVLSLNQSGNIFE